MPKIVNEALYLSISQIASYEFHAPFSERDGLGEGPFASRD